MGLLESLVEEAARRDGSDIHVRSGEQPRVRVHREIQTISDRSLDAETVLEILLPYLSGAESFDTNMQPEFDCAAELAGRRCRLHIFVDNRGLGAVVRLLPCVVPSIEGLRLPPVVASLAQLPRGLVLVTGAAGAGKSSTLAAIVNQINRNRAAHIITLEDPIEVLHQPSLSLVTQRQVARDSRSFAAGLRASLRQDPDVLLVGEMRDSETADLVLAAAETGHLVLTTLHAGTAVQSISRMVDLFPSARQLQARAALAESLAAVINQELCPGPEGGRVPVVEVLLATPAVRALIREGKTHQLEGVMQASAHLGMLTRAQRIRQLREAAQLA